MRRSKRRGATSSDTVLKSSSEDSDHQNTMKIIEKMSKKLMGPMKHVPRKTHVADTNKRFTKKCSTPLPRVTRSRSKSRRDVAYEGDIDSSTGTTTASDGSTDLYDFNQSDEENLCLVLFPSSSKSTKTKARTKKVSPKNSVTTAVSQKKKVEQRVCTVKNSNKKSKASNPTQEETHKQKQRLSSKRKEAPTVPITPVTKKSVVEKTDSHRSETSMFDSGVFVSPIERVVNSSLNTPNLTPIPTPSLSLSSMSVDERPAPPQFDSLLEDPPELSPVKRPAVERMDLGSPRLKTPIAEKTYAHRGQFQSPSEKIEKKKKARSKPRVTSKRVDAWATQMNAEFNEIEMYDLSIEDQ